jgi:hypothetical protein
MSAKRLSASTLAIWAVMAFFLIIAWRWSWNDGPAVIRSDASGYYGYLRAIFINQDLGHEQPDPTYLHPTPSGTLNKYFAGEAVMLLPFFGAAHAYAHLSGAATDGLSKPYSLGIGIAALFYVAVGLFCFRALMRRSGISEGNITITLLALGSGTQLVQYVTLQPGWSHVYSFAAISGLLLLMHRLSEGADVRTLLGCGALFGLVVLIRPVNALAALALPVVLGERTPMVLGALARRWGTLLLAAAAFAAQTGHLIADGYRDEGFYWNRPAIFNVLLGVRRGLFVWTPVLILCVLAIVHSWRGDRWRALGALVYWAANTYVIACWWIWYYGSGWGQRVYVDHYPVLFLPLAFALGRWSSLARKAVLLALTTATLFTLAQFYQYNHRLLDVEGMDRQKYTYAFLRFDDAHRDRMGGMYRVPPFCPNGLDTLLHEKWTVAEDAPHWRAPTRELAERFRAQGYVSTGSADEFGPEFSMRADELPDDRALYLAVGFERRAPEVGATRSVLVIVTLEDSLGKASFYQSFNMDPLPPTASAWEHIEYRIPVQRVKAGERLKFYLWNQQGTARLDADELDMTVMSVRPY